LILILLQATNTLAHFTLRYEQEETNVRVSQYGAHLFHTIYEDVWNYVQRFGAWTPYEHKVRGIVNKKYVPIPVNIETVNTLFGLNITNEQEMDEWLKKEQIPIPDGRTPRNSEEVALSRVGQRLYDLIFKPYTFKQWNKYPAELGPEVLQRIPVRNDFDERYFSDPHQALPTHGYTSLFENMLKSRHITVITNSDYFKIRDNVSCGKHYFTGPIDAYFADHNMPKLEYRSLSFERKVAKNTKFFQPAFVVNHPQDNDDYTRIVEYKHLYNQSHLPHTVYFIERSSDYGEPYYPVPNERNKDLYEQYQALAQQEEQNKNVSFVGRLASYKYFNMDQAIKAALEMFEKHTGIPYDMIDHGTATTSAKISTKLETVRKEPQLLRLRSEKSRLLKADWHQAMDCSAWDNMCFATQQAKNQYKPYPFPLSRHEKYLEDFNHQPMAAIPSEWKKSLALNSSLDKPPPRQVEYIYPPEVAVADKEQCLKAARSLSWQEQVRRLLRTRVQREPTTNMTAFTISDYNYAEDMIHDVFEMNDRIVGFPEAFFMVAIDEKTLEMACRFGYPVVAWTSAVQKDTAAASDTDELKHAVANTKFEVSLELIKQGESFFFYEMDVWFLRSPKDLIAYYHNDDKHDILLSSHMNCPMCLNIGTWSRISICF
jgi:UDP-galactopyranose mutase